MTSSLKFSEYGTAIHIDKPTQIQVDRDWRNLLRPVLSELGVCVPENTSTEESLRILHGLLAPIDANVMSDDLVQRIEMIAAGNNAEWPSTDPFALPTIASEYSNTYPARHQTCVWVGDITKLKVDAIVNAANTELLGCRIPNHPCIDNAIHSAAGPRLRDDCATIIRKQMTSEPVGSAKITRGYALPARYVLHTVGPQLRRGDAPNNVQRGQLVNAYNSCLDLAAKIEAIRSIAFCAISTGIFGYPKKEAANIALTTVANWFDAYPNRFDRVVFNLYSAADAAVYKELLSEW